MRTYSQMHHTDKYSQHSSVIWSVWLNGCVFVYELSFCGSKSLHSHLIFRYCPCFQQRVPWHSGSYRMWIHSRTRRWHDNNIHSNDLYREVLTAQLNHLANLGKCLSVHLQIKWLWVWIPLQSLKLQILRFFRTRSSLTFRQLLSVYSLWSAYVTW